MNYCVVGLQWGDEGKGKVVDILAENSDIVVRYSGGANAGHTVKIDDQEGMLERELVGRRTNGHQAGGWLMGRRWFTVESPDPMIGACELTSTEIH